MISIQARMANAMIGLAHKYPNEEIALFSHGDPLRAALCYWLGMPLDHLLRLDVAPGSISIVRLNEWSVQVPVINERP